MPASALRRPRSWRQPFPKHPESVEVLLTEALQELDVALEELRVTEASRRALRARSSGA